MHNEQYLVLAEWIWLSGSTKKVVRLEKIVRSPCFHVDCSDHLCGCAILLRRRTPAKECFAAFASDFRVQQLLNACFHVLSASNSKFMRATYIAASGRLQLPSAKNITVHHSLRGWLRISSSSHSTARRQASWLQCLVGASWRGVSTKFTAK